MEIVHLHFSLQLYIYIYFFFILKLILRSNVFLLNKLNKFENISSETYAAKWFSNERGYPENGRGDRFIVDEGDG